MKACRYIVANILAELAVHILDNVQFAFKCLCVSRLWSVQVQSANKVSNAAN